MTVAECIALLQKMPQDAKVVTDAGEATVTSAREVTLGYMYQYARGERYGMSNYLFSPEKVERKKNIPSVYIG